MLTHAVVLLVASLASGQAEARRPVDDFAKLRGFLGTWEAKGVEIQGRKTDSPVSWKPILDGQFIELKWMFIDVAKNTSEWGLVILGRDPADKRVRGWGFDDVGGFMAWESMSSPAKARILPGRPFLPRAGCSNTKAG